ncbi:hypothetical protein [Microcoleus sp.]|uniref:hypothetical protein n=1 Tax=Microcoleus sp. TaxID=44472 RepID=UPI0035930F56
MAERNMGFWSVVAVGVFAVLGLSVQLAQGGAPLAFAIAGIVALLTTYAYVQLSIAFPSRGGTVTFLNKAFGTGVLTGGMNLLLWLSYIVMLSLYASAFGSYGAVFFPESAQVWIKHLLISGAIVGITGLNFLSYVLIYLATAICSCPTKSSRVWGRIRSVRGSWFCLHSWAL